MTYTSKHRKLTKKRKRQEAFNGWRRFISGKQKWQAKFLRSITSNTSTPSH